MAFNKQLKQTLSMFVNLEIIKELTNDVQKYEKENNMSTVSESKKSHYMKNHNGSFSYINVKSNNSVVEESYIKQEQVDKSELQKLFYKNMTITNFGKYTEYFLEERYFNINIGEILDVESNNGERRIHKELYSDLETKFIFQKRLYDEEQMILEKTRDINWNTDERKDLTKFKNLYYGKNVKGLSSFIPSGFDCADIGIETKYIINDDVILQGELSIDNEDLTKFNINDYMLNYQIYCDDVTVPYIKKSKYIYDCLSEYFKFLSEMEEKEVGTRKMSFK